LPEISILNVSAPMEISEISLIFLTLQAKLKVMDLTSEKSTSLLTFSAHCCHFGGTGSSNMVKQS
jgi:hypothetical protein